MSFDTFLLIASLTALVWVVRAFLSARLEDLDLR